MTLSRQLLLLIITLLLLLFAGTFYISVHNAKGYLVSQMESHAQDAATSLGLSVSPHLAQQDIATVTSMTDAIFDRGYYRMVRVQDMEGKPIVDRSLPVVLEEVPGWFIARFSLDTPEGRAVIMGGWMQLGEVVVRSHPGLAYRQLWESSLETFWLFLATALLGLLIGMILLRHVLNPLKAMEAQADAIARREFPVIEPLPKTLDLRSIVSAMNRMSNKVRQMLEDNQRLAEGLRKQAHISSVTGLSNKRFFFDAVSNLIDTPEECSTALFALVQLRSFKEYNDIHGYPAGDQLLLEAGGALSSVADQYEGAHLGHLSGADFALFLPNRTESDADQLGQQLSTALAGLYGTGLLDSPDVGHAGISAYRGEGSLSELLADADSALHNAQTEGANAWHLHSAAGSVSAASRGAGDWRTTLIEALESNRFTLQYQPVLACADRRVMHQEVFVRLEEAGQKLSAGAFMPQAESLGLTAEIDRVVIGKVLERLMYETESGFDYAINLSPPSLQRETFIDWLEQQLSAHKAVAHRLIFETSEYGAVANLEQVDRIIDILNRYGASFSLDHFGRSQSAFGYLKSLKVDYLKIDGSYLRTLHESLDNQFFIQALADIAHGLDIRVIGESIETEESWRLLKGLNVDGAQGYYLGRPE